MRVKAGLAVRKGRRIGDRNHNRKLRERVKFAIKSPDPHNATTQKNLIRSHFLRKIYAVPFMRHETQKEAC